MHNRVAVVPERRIRTRRRDAEKTVGRNPFHELETFNPVCTGPLGAGIRITESEDSIELAVPARQLELDGMKFNSYRVAPCRDGDVPDVVLVRVRNLPFPYYSELVRALANSGFAEKVLILNANILADFRLRGNDRSRMNGHCIFSLL